MINLPAAFTERMKQMLGREYDAFIASYDKERSQGLRVNGLKTDPAEFAKTAPFSLNPVAWAAEGFAYGAEDRPGRHPYHDAGVYYIQEPSAMIAASLLNPQPGEMFLDLCAAPGGKSTQAAARLGGEGLLVSNEIHPARAKILSQNIERMGIRNAVVTNEDSGRLTKYFPAFFDGIIVDAPCSGEGMFRKDETAVTDWSPENVRRCAGRTAGVLHLYFCAGGGRAGDRTFLRGTSRVCARGNAGLSGTFARRSSLGGGCDGWNRENGPYLAAPDRGRRPLCGTSSKNGRAGEREA